MKPSLAAYAFLAGAIVCEVLGTTLLQKSEQFTRLLPTVGMVLFYVGSFFCLSQTLKSIPLGIAYASWGGLGIILTTIIGTVLFKQQIDLPALIGIGMIIAGVITVHLFSQTTTHS